MKKFSVKITSFDWLDSNQINYVLRIAPKYVKWENSGSEDMVITEFKTLREARVFIMSFYAVMNAANVNLTRRDKCGFVHLIGCDIQK
jgi:hypothetical protein